VRKPGGKASKNGARPAKVTDLVEQCLVQNGEPQSAAEVATSISTKERPVSVISVRTALEGLVRRSAAYRSKQGRAVYYQHVNSTAAVTQDA
jgi:predicted transcriptional regulator